MPYRYRFVSLCLAGSSLALLGVAAFSEPEISKNASKQSMFNPSMAVHLSPQTCTSVLSKRSNLDVSKPYGYHLNPILERIKASNDQRLKISQIMQSYRFKIQPLRDTYMLKQQEFISSMVGGGSAEQIMSKQIELGHLSSEISSEYWMMRLEIRRLL